ncbi:DUF402 domain-containing protein [Phytomonospora sp. NPDC050363]|uniref:DUF402 domain-containing protein n=1 Tax=Phytomonospora sp. NPDC050363 TaxID=3155642 RepID=UPI003405C831
MPAPIPFPRRRASKLRHPDVLAAHWYEYVLGEDESGVWAILPRGGKTWWAVSGDVTTMGDDQLRLYPHGGGWAAQFWQPGRELHILHPDGTEVTRQVAVLDYVDMVLGPVCDATGVSFVDLVLDVVRYPDGTVAIVDEDEVDEEVVRYGIPLGHIDRARADAAEVHTAMARRLPPFDGTAELWRARFHASVPAG